MVCVVGKMSKDIGMTIHKVLRCCFWFSSFFGIPSQYVFKMCFFVTCFCCFLGGERYGYTEVRLGLAPATQYI